MVSCWRRAKAASEEAAFALHYSFYYSLSSLSFSDCFHLSKSPSVVEPEFDELELEPLPLPPLPLPLGAADAS